jgi:protein-S-isoprenylcysteine O-methyltransferase Ste14
MYTGGFLLFAGIGAVLQSIIGLALTGLLVLPLLVYSAVEEERRMLDKFGEEYADYKKHTVF